MKGLSTSALIALCAIVGTLAPGPLRMFDQKTPLAWSELGPSGGDIRGIAFNPLNPKELWAVSKSGQVFKTADSGKTWTRTAYLADELFDIAIAPSRPSVLFALGADALFRSEDGGRTWAKRPLPSGGHGDEGRLSVHPKAPDTVFAAGNIRSGTSKWMAVFKTTNGGQSWTATKLAATSHDGTARSVAVDPINTSTVYVCGGYNDTKKYYIFKSVDSGKTWRDFTGTVQGLPYELIVDPADSAKVYITTTGGLGFYQSHDGGKTWQDSGGDGFGCTMGLSPTNPRTLFTSLDASWVYRSFGGENWVDLKTGFYGEARRFAIVPGVIHLASISGLIKSVNAGLTWTLNQEGITATRIAAVAPAPSSPSLLYAVAYDQGVAKSADDGRTWKIVWPIYGCESIPSLSVHPKNSNRLLVLLESG